MGSGGKRAHNHGPHLINGSQSTPGTKHPRAKQRPLLPDNVTARPAGLGLVWVPGRAHPQAHDGLQTYQLDGRVLAYRGDDGYRGLGFDPGEVA